MGKNNKSANWNIVIILLSLIFVNEIDALSVL